MLQLIKSNRYLKKILKLVNKCRFVENINISKMTNSLPSKWRFSCIWFKYRYRYVLNWIHQNFTKKAIAMHTAVKYSYFKCDFGTCPIKLSIRVPFKYQRWLHYPMVIWVKQVIKQYAIVWWCFTYVSLISCHRSKYYVILCFCIRMIFPGR